MVPVSKMSTMMSMVLTFEDMEGRKKADMELVDGLPDDGPHPEHQVGGHQVHQTKMWKAAHKSHLQAGKPEIMDVITYMCVDCGGSTHYDDNSLEDDKHDGEDAVGGYKEVRAVRVEVDDEEGDEL